jgi:hypothetical protein
MYRIDILDKEPGVDEQKGNLKKDEEGDDQEKSLDNEEEVEDDQSLSTKKFNRPDIKDRVISEENQRPEGELTEDDKPFFNEQFMTDI